MSIGGKRVIPRDSNTSYELMKSEKGSQFLVIGKLCGRTRVSPTLAFQWTEEGDLSNSIELFERYIETLQLILSNRKFSCGVTLFRWTGDERFLLRCCVHFERTMPRDGCSYWSFASKLPFSGAKGGHDLEKSLRWWVAVFLAHSISRLTLW